jgi:hypothetical protein
LNEGGSDGRVAITELVEASAEASQVLKDMAYSSLLQEFRNLDAVKGANPVEVMKKVESIMKTFTEKHKSKMRYIPGMETAHSDITGMMNEMGVYRRLHEEAEQVKNMQLLQRVAGPNKTIMNIINDDKVAQEMSDFLGNVNSKMSESGTVMSAKYPNQFQMSPQNSEAVVTKMQDTMMNAFIDEFTIGTVLNHEGMSSILSNIGGSRQNLVNVMGEARVMKLEAMASVSQAMTGEKVKFLDVLQNDNVLKGMEKLGLPLNRVASRLNQRAVFRPSTAYLAASVATSILNNVAKRDTGQALKILMDDPTKLAEFDKHLGKAIQELNAAKKDKINGVLQNPNGSLRDLIGTLADHLGQRSFQYYSYLGFNTPKEVYVEAVKEALLTDPRRETNDKKGTEAKKGTEVKEGKEGNTDKEDSMVSSKISSEAPTESPESLGITNQPITSPEQETPQSGSKGSSGITNVPQVPPSDPTSALSTRKPMAEIRDMDITRAMNNMTAEERLRYMENINKGN